MQKLEEMNARAGKDSKVTSFPLKLIKSISHDLRS